MAVAARPAPRRHGFIARAIVPTLILGVIAAMAVEPTRQLIEQRNRISSMTQDVNEIEGLNAALRDRLGRLKDVDYVEQKARLIGYAKEGETAFIVLPPSVKMQKRQERVKAAAAEQAAEVVAPKPGAIESFLNFLGF